MEKKKCLLGQLFGSTSGFFLRCSFFSFVIFSPSSCLSFDFHTLSGGCFFSLWCNVCCVVESNVRVFLVLSGHTGEEACSP